MINAISVVLFVICCLLLLITAWLALSTCILGTYLFCCNKPSQDDLSDVSQATIHEGIALSVNGHRVSHQSSVSHSAGVEDLKLYIGEVLDEASKSISSTTSDHASITFPPKPEMPRIHRDSKSALSSTPIQAFNHLGTITTTVCNSQRPSLSVVSSVQGMPKSTIGHRVHALKVELRQRQIKFRISRLKNLVYENNFYQLYYVRQATTIIGCIMLSIITMFQLLQSNIITLNFEQANILCNIRVYSFYTLLYLFFTLTHVGSALRAQLISNMKFSKIPAFKTIKFIFIAVMINICIFLPISLYFVQPHVNESLLNQQQSEYCSDGPRYSINIALSLIFIFTLMGYIVNAYIYHVLLKLLLNEPCATESPTTSASTMQLKSSKQHTLACRYLSVSSTFISFIVYYLHPQTIILTNSIALACFGFSICVSIISITLSNIESSMWIFPCCLLYQLRAPTSKRVTKTVATVYAASRDVDTCDVEFGSSYEVGSNKKRRPSKSLPSFISGTGAIINKQCNSPEV